MISAGVPFSLCCDNLLLSGAADRAATPSGELVRLVSDVLLQDQGEGADLSSLSSSSFSEGQPSMGEMTEAEAEAWAIAAESIRSGLRASFAYSSLSRGWKDRFQRDLLAALPERVVRKMKKE